jgi:hypothetical protein
VSKHSAFVPGGAKRQREQAEEIESKHAVMYSVAVGIFEDADLVSFGRLPSAEAVRAV